MAADEKDDSHKNERARQWIDDLVLDFSFDDGPRDFLHGRLPLRRLPVSLDRNLEFREVEINGGRPTKWKWQPEIMFGEKNDLTRQDQLSTIMLASILARLGGEVRFIDRELESCNLTLEFERETVNGVAMHRVATRYPTKSPIDKINDFADRWEQRAATLAPDAAGEIIDMAAELRALAGRLFE